MFRQPLGRRSDPFGIELMHGYDMQSSARRSIYVRGAKYF